MIGGAHGRATSGVAPPPGVPAGGGAGGAAGGGRRAAAARPAAAAAEWTAAAVVVGGVVVVSGGGVRLAAGRLRLRLPVVSVVRRLGVVVCVWSSRPRLHSLPRVAAQPVARVAQALAQPLVDGRGQVVDAVVDLAQLAADVVAAAVLDGLLHVLDLALQVAGAGGRDAALRAAAAGDEQRGADAERSASR